MQDILHVLYPRATAAELMAMAAAMQARKRRKRRVDDYAAQVRHPALMLEHSLSPVNLRCLPDNSFLPCSFATSFHAQANAKVVN